MLLVVSACANDGVPESWDDQIDDSGRGLVVRQFEESCVEANEDLPRGQIRRLCGCVIDHVRNVVTYEKFKELGKFITKHRDELTSAVLEENYNWFTSAVEDCSD